MQCLECSHPALTAGLVVAMEQREHLALQRHAEICSACAAQVYTFLSKRGSGSRHWSQCVNCAFCGGKMPAIRLRFDVLRMGLKHLALCSSCYSAMRSDLMVDYPNLVTWIDKEWDTTEKSTKRMPWPKGTVVRVKHRVPRFHDRVGVVEACRGLVQPYFGYDIRFDEHCHHFFHERDLEPVVEKAAQPVG